MDHLEPDDFPANEVVAELYLHIVFSTRKQEMVLTDDILRRLPEEFDLLASNDACCVQAIKHKSRLLYGTQFHPEHFDVGHPDGEKILRNFFSLAGILKPDDKKGEKPAR